MIAQKLENNKIIIGNNLPREDALEVIYNLKVAEFFRLSKCVDNWTRLDNKKDAIYTIAKNGSNLLKEFDKIYKRRNREKLNREKVEIIKESKSEIYSSKVKGSCRLVFLKSRNSVTLLKRYGEDNLNKPNSVCIDDSTKKEFIKDCNSKKKTTSIRKTENKELFTKWKNKITELYQGGLNNDRE